MTSRGIADQKKNPSSWTGKLRLSVSQSLRISPSPRLRVPASSNPPVPFPSITRPAPALALRGELSNLRAAAVYHFKRLGVGNARRRRQSTPRLVLGVRRVENESRR
jgi:hypothetical protein